MSYLAYSEYNAASLLIRHHVCITTGEEVQEGHVAVVHLMI